MLAQLNFGPLKGINVIVFCLLPTSAAVSLGIWFAQWKIKIQTFSFSSCHQSAVISLQERLCCSWSSSALKPSFSSLLQLWCLVHRSTPSAMTRRSVSPYPTGFVPLKTLSVWQDKNLVVINAFGSQSRQWLQKVFRLLDFVQTLYCRFSFICGMWKCVSSFIPGLFPCFHITLYLSVLMRRSKLIT